MAELTPSQWDTFLEQFPDAHILQTSAWGELKSAFGWKAARLQTGTGESAVGAQILFRRLPLGFQIAYIAKGPLGCGPCSAPEAAQQAFWAEASKLCRQRRAILLKVEPDAWEGNAPATPPPLFQLGKHSIQPPRTILIDIRGDEEQVLGAMKQKTRYNIRLAQKKGVMVQASADIEPFHRLMQVTGGRDRFGIHSLRYYQKAYDIFHSHGMCELLMAEYEGIPLAGLMVFAHGKRAWYFYGASASDHRDRMPTYLLQWEAIRWARSRGCTEYDLWGVPDAGEDTLEANFTERSNGLWGVYRFKRGFGGALCRSQGPWDQVFNRPIYKLYDWWATRS